jgi:hypothetical protein
MKLKMLVLNQNSSNIYCLSVTTHIVIEAVRCSLLLEGLDCSYSRVVDEVRWTHEFLGGSGRLTPYVYWSCITMCEKNTCELV